MSSIGLIPISSCRSLDQWRSAPACSLSHHRRNMLANIGLRCLQCDDAAAKKF